MLNKVFRYKPDTHRILIWAFNSRAANDDPSNKLSIWCNDELNIKYDREAYKNHDLYFGLGTTKHRIGMKQRAKIDQIDGIGCFWADIDILNDHHKKKNIPETIEKAISILGELPFQPSIIVNSGGGLHVYWLFNEYWEFDTDAERQKAIRLSQNWQALVRSVFQRHNYTIDATADLTRVLRIPGEINHKYNKTVTIHSESDNEFGIDQFEALEYVETSESSIVHIPEMNIVIDPNANPPSQKMLLIFESKDDKFIDTWNNDRPDLDKKDASPSSYDFALCMYGFKYGWNEQEIVDLLIAYRRRHGHDLKLNRTDNYYARTLTKARELWKSTHENPGEVSDLKPDTVLAHISNAIGIEILEFIQYAGDEPIYQLVINSEKKGIIKIQFDDIRGVLDYKTLSLKIAETIHKMPKTIIKQKTWEKLFELLIGITVEKESPDTTAEGQIRNWVSKYIRPIISDDIDHQIEHNLPYRDEGHVYFNAMEFNKYLANQEKKYIKMPKLSSILEASGFVYRSTQYPKRDDKGNLIKGKYWHRRLWFIHESKLSNHANYLNESEEK